MEAPTAESLAGNDVIPQGHVATSATDPLEDLPACQWRSMSVEELLGSVVHGSRFADVHDYAFDLF